MTSELSMMPPLNNGGVTAWVARAFGARVGECVGLNMLLQLGVNGSMTTLSLRLRVPVDLQGFMRLQSRSEVSDCRPGHLHDDRYRLRPVWGIRGGAQRGHERRPIATENGPVMS